VAVLSGKVIFCEEKPSAAVSFDGAIFCGDWQMVAVSSGEAIFCEEWEDIGRVARRMLYGWGCEDGVCC
jgi:hypothetical protein